MARKLSRQGERALEAANDLASEGLEAAGEERLDLARQALARSPLCADAHVLFAMEAPKASDEALAHWRRAVSAAAMALGPAGFRGLAPGGAGSRHAGAYIRALHGLAEALWARGERGEAIETLSRAVRGDPEGEFVLHYTLLGWLIVEGDDGSAAALLTATSDGENNGVEWFWAGLLIAFRGRGDTEDTRGMLREMADANARIAPILIAGAVPEDAWPPGTSPLDPLRQDFDEAEMVLESLGDAWRVTPGALDWLARAIEASAQGPDGA